MWSYNTEDLNSIVYIEPKTNNLVIKIIGFDNYQLAEMFAHFVMANIQFDYDPVYSTTQSKMIH